MSVKLQLDASALSMLMESMGDEFTMMLGQGVLEEACRRHIKAVVTPATKDLIAAYAQEVIVETIGTVTQPNWNGPKVVKLSPVLEAEIKDKIRRVLSEELDAALEIEALKKAMTEHINLQAESIKRRIKTEIDLLMIRRTNEEINKEVDRRVIALLKK